MENKLSPVYVSILYQGVTPVKFWLDEISSNIGILRISFNECIKTTACDTQEDIINLLQWLETINNAIEVEL